MSVLLGLLAFVVVLATTLLLRERHLRVGWQKIASTLLSKRSVHGPNQDSAADRAVDLRDR